MTWQDLLKAVLPTLVSWLTSLIPMVGGLLGGPLGWIASLLLPWLTSLLYDWITQLITMKVIDAEVAAQVASAQATTSALISAQNTLGVDRAKALADFTAAHRILGQFTLH